MAAAEALERRTGLAVAGRQRNRFAIVRQGRVAVARSLEQSCAIDQPLRTVAIVFDNTVVPPTYQITVTWTEPGEVPNYSITIPVFGI